MVNKSSGIIFDNNSIETDGKLMDKELNIANQALKKISFPAYFFLLYISATIFNQSQFGAYLSVVFLPISLYFFAIVLTNSRINLRMAHLICILFWIQACISTYFSEIVQPQRDLLTFLIFCLFYIVVTAYKFTKKDIVAMLFVYVLIAVASSLDIIWNFIQGYEYGWKRYSLYFFGTYKDPNYVSAFIVPAIGIMFYKLIFFSNLKMIKRVIYSIALLIMIFGSFATGSRSAYIMTLGILAAAYVYYLISAKGLKALLRSASFFALIIGGWNLLRSVLPHFTIERLTDFNSYSDNVRIILWKTGIQLFSSHPFWGAGLSSLTSYLYGEQLFDSHNVFLDIVCGQGLIGFIIFSVILFDSLRVKKQDIVLMLILMIGLFAPLFFINGFNTATFWTPMILCQLLANFSRHSDKGLQEVMNEL